jgi:iron complex outermembrane receptor protein
MVGAGYRLMHDLVGNSAALAFLPPKRNMQLFSTFAQDEITLIPDRLKVTIGTKFEHNDFSGFEVEPSGRIAWTPNDNQTIWGAISRAVRSPSRIDSDFYAPGNPPFFLAGGPDFDSEAVLAYELGYRFRVQPKVTLSLAAFYNDYEDIRSVEPIPNTTNSFVIANGLRGDSWGVELSGTYQVTDWWRLRGGYTYLHEQTFLKPGSQDINAGTAEGNDPQHQFSLQSMLDLPCHFELDSNLRYVDRLPSPHVPSYFTVDLHLAWHTTPNLEFAIVGQNLCDNQHPEFGAAGARQEIPRSVYGKVTWRF